MSAAEARRRQGAVRRAWWLSTPALLVLAAGAIAPLGIVLVYSFLTPAEGAGVRQPVTTQAWQSILFARDIFTGELGWADAHLAILWRSVWLSLVTTLTTLVLGLPTAWFIATRPPSRRALWLFLMTIPFWTNLLIRTFAIGELIRREGVMNTVLLKLGVIAAPLDLMFTPTAVMIGMTYVYLPLMVLPLYAALERFDMRLLEAAHDLYASRWQVLWRIVLPIVRPGLVAGSILVFVPSLGAYVTPRILGGQKAMMVGNFIEFQFGQGRNWPLGAALSMVLLLIVGAALAVYVRAMQGGERDGAA